MKELDRIELQEVEGGYTKIPPWVKNGFWFGIACIAFEHWTEIKSGIADGWSDAMNSK